MKKVPLRRCVVTNKSYPKMELFRIVKTNKNEVLLDMTGKVNGRGAYIHKDAECIEKARKTKVLERVLEIKIDDALYDRMYQFLDL